LWLHTLFRGDDYGKVTPKQSGQDFLTKRCRLSRKRIGEALKTLEDDLKFITRDRTPRKNHGHDIIHTLPLLELVAADLGLPAPQASDLPMSQNVTLGNESKRHSAARAFLF